jgi:hypothetical protein
MCGSIKYLAESGARRKMQSTVGCENTVRLYAPNPRGARPGKKAEKIRVPKSQTQSPAGQLGQRSNTITENLMRPIKSVPRGQAEGLASLTAKGFDRTELQLLNESSGQPLP